MRTQTLDAACANAIAAERGRIARDLHDGLGSRLVALLARLDPHDATQHDLADSLRECLLDLQTTVDAFEDGAEQSIAGGLARLRYRLQPAFDRVGILVVWDVDETRQGASIAAGAAAEICKIAQEAISNVLRHSRARRLHVTLDTVSAAGAIRVEIEDDGLGMAHSVVAATDNREGGHGLNNMRFRARRLGAQLDIFGSVPHGLCVKIIYPHGG